MTRTKLFVHLCKEIAEKATYREQIKPITVHLLDWVGKVVVCPLREVCLVVLQLCHSRPVLLSGGGKCPGRQKSKYWGLYYAQNVWLSSNTCLCSHMQSRSQERFYFLIQLSISQTWGGIQEKQNTWIHWMQKQWDAWFIKSSNCPLYFEFYRKEVNDKISFCHQCLIII